MEMAIKPFTGLEARPPFGGFLFPSGRSPGGTSVLHGKPGRWVVWEAQEIS